MKIKTVVEYVPENFDERVNEALGEGYVLGHRDLLPPDCNRRTAHYAQLVLPDPPAEPAPPDPFEALHIVKEFCRSIPLHTCANACPLYDWCEQLREGGDPTDWRIPEKEADQ